jgi:hypothetical protein
MIGWCVGGLEPGTCSQEAPLRPCNPTAELWFRTASLGTPRRTSLAEVSFRSGNLGPGARLELCFERGGIIQ